MNRSPSFQLLLVCLLVLTLSNETLLADDSTDLLTLSAKFESARVSGNVESAERLTAADANWITDASKDSSSILADIRSTAERAAKGQTVNSESFVADRTVQVSGDSAVVNELVRITSTPSQPPLRRSLYWARDQGGWKLVHAHVSPYLRWETSIAAFEEQDKETPPERRGVVFIGSSSIRRWDSLAKDFPGVAVINRGFGGSQMIDSVLCAKRVVTPYEPLAVVVYAGDNDLAKGKNAERVCTDFKNFVTTIQRELPGTKIGFIAIKPSLKRWNLWPEMVKANDQIKAFAAMHENIDFLDIATPMLGEEGTPIPELFVKDGLHLTDRGYAIWTNVIRPWVHQATSSN